MPVNQKTLARAPPRQGDASEWTRFKRLSTDASVEAPKQNPQAVYRFPFPRIQQIWQGIVNPPSAPPGVPGDWAREQQLTTSSGDPRLEVPASWGTANPSAATLPHFQKGADGELFPQFNATGLGVYDQAVIHLTGYFRPPVTGSYVFNVSSDDGFQLVVNGTRILDSRVPTTRTMLTNGLNAVNSSTISLTAGIQYPIEGLWVNGTGGLQLIINSIKVNGSDIPGAIFDTFYH